MWGYKRLRYRVGFKRLGVTYIIVQEKGGGYMNRDKIYVCSCIWKTEINYLVNKNGHDWVEGMQLGEELGYSVFTALKRLVRLG